ncbi:hypothetical protein ABE504_23855 [Paenibacillus oryzisoli]|uniref:hypothetical protein n=1 Tax=Paenibacillus oryzisoli TaxID=1850517 RepID=UPI003D2840E4
MTNWVNVAGYKIDNGQVFATLASHTKVGAYIFVTENEDEETVEYQIDPKTNKLTGYNLHEEEELEIDAMASEELLDFILNHEGVKMTANPKWVDVAGYKINDNKVYALTVSYGEVIYDSTTGDTTETRKNQDYLRMNSAHLRIVRKLVTQ